MYIYFQTGNSKKKVQIINNTPYITVDCNFTGRIYSMKNNAEYLDDTILQQISESASNYMKLQMNNYLYKTSKVCKSDINGFGKSSLSNFTTLTDFENYNWLENYENSFFKVNMNVSVKSGFLLTET